MIYVGVIKIARRCCVVRGAPLFCHNTQLAIIKRSRAPKAARQITRQSEQEMKILSVDDDPIFLEIMKSELTNLGYSDVVQASSGNQALDIVRDTTDGIDCFLLDIDMPGMDGVTLCERLRGDARTRDATIIMVTSRAEMESVERAFSVGATDYLNKPLNPLELRGRLKSTEALVNERTRNAADNPNAAGGQAFAIDEPIRLDPSVGCIDYLAMQNFILKLGTMQMFNRAALAVHVHNIEDIYTMMAPDDVRGTLSDVAEVIVDALGSCPKVMTYAGSGDFVVLLNRARTLDQEAIVEAMSNALSALGTFYSDFGAPVPVLKVGDPVSHSFLSLSTTDEVIDKAIERARSSEFEIRYQSNGGVIKPPTKKSSFSLWYQ